MNFEEFQERVQTERSIRTQRDAAEKGVPLERLRRALRESFVRERLGEDREAGVEPDLEPPNGKG